MPKKFFKEYFSFSRREQNGILVLSSVIGILILINISISLFPAKRLAVDTEDMRRAIEDFNRMNQNTMARDSIQRLSMDHGDLELSRNIRPFDPNRISLEDLLDFGIPDRVANTMHNYVDKGGHFYRNEDLLKIYGMDESLYHKLEPYIRIEREGWNDMDSDKTTIDIPPVKQIDLNKADTSELLPLKGIGPVLARRILKYRNILGGFTSSEQLLEVYGISEEVYHQIADHLVADSTLVLKLDLNQATYANLIRHPYFDHDLVFSLIEKRKEKGGFNSLEEIKEAGSLSEEAFKKIIPYIRLDK